MLSIAASSAGPAKAEMTRHNQTTSRCVQCFISCPTSKMSHDHGRRAACGMTIWSREFDFEIHEGARGVTAMVVGSGALLGRFCRDGKWLGLKSMIMVNRLGASSLRWGCNLKSHLRSKTETLLRLRNRAACFLIAANA